MLRLSTFTLLLASSLSLSTALVVPKSFGTPHHSQDGLIILDLDAVVGSSSRSKHHTALLDASIDAAVGTTNYLVEIVADSTVASSHRKKLHPRSPTPTPSFLNADLDATLLSVEKGLVDATPTINSGGTDLVGAVVKSGKGALIALDVLATVLGPQQCTGNAFIGLKAEVTFGRLLHVCACIEVLGLLDKNTQACPACPVNADPICGSGECGCKCRDGFFSDRDNNCLPVDDCLSTGGYLRHHRDGSTSCKCPSPFVSNHHGGCTLPPSIRARRFSRQLTQQQQALLSYSSLVDGDAYQCSGANERACPVGRKGSYECLDTSQEIESCGGCPGEASSVNCLTIPGVENVGCFEAKCVISSCLSGHRYLNGRCVRATQE